MGSSSATEGLNHLTKHRAVVVLGVGRSGTSAVTRGLSALGVELGSHLRRAARLKNPTGFFEDIDLLRINKRLKRILNVRGDTVRLLEPDWWRQPAVQDLQREAVATIRRRFGACPLWGFKYARTLRFMPFWCHVFAEADIEACYLMVIRNPLSVAKSRSRLDPWRGSQEKSDLEWIVNVVPYFRQVRHHALVVVDFDHFIADPASQLTRIARRLDLPMTPDHHAATDEYVDRFLDSALRHSQHTAADLDRDPCVNNLTRAAYFWLYRLAIDEADPCSPETWQEWQRIENALAELAPVLQHIDRAEARLRMARCNPLGPLQAIPWLWQEVRRRWPAR
jgi:hypothetical protein